MPYLYDPLTEERHGPLTWRRPPDGRFSAGLLRADLAFEEVGRCAAALPIVFFPGEEGAQAVAVSDPDALGAPNLSSDGAWARAYLPFMMRMHPFAVVQDITGRAMLGVARDGACVGAGFEERFFEAGQPARTLRATLRLGQRFIGGRNRLQQAALLLMKLELFSRLSPEAEWAISFGRPVYVVDRRKLAAKAPELLSGDVQAWSGRADALHLAAAAAASIRHLRPEFIPDFARVPRLEKAKPASLMAVVTGGQQTLALESEGASFLVQDEDMLQFQVHGSSRYFSSG